VIVEFEKAVFKNRFAGIGIALSEKELFVFVDFLLVL
jgi:hypothetical protein